MQSDHTFGHGQAQAHPLLWALVHGSAVLAAAAFQLVAWRFTEIEEKRAREDLDESQAQLSVAFDETPVAMAMFQPDGRMLRTNSAYREWLNLPAELPDGFSVHDLPLRPADPDQPTMVRLLTEAREPITVTRQFHRTDTDSLIWVQMHATGLYGPDGEFWGAHPQLTPRPIREWQVWNE